MTKISPRKMKIYHAELEKIRKVHGGGTVRPQDVVDAARPKTSPLHSRFTWDDSLAGERYRLWEARQLISEITVITTSMPTPAPAYVSIVEDRKRPGGGYRAMSDVVKSKTLRKMMLRDALIDAQRFEQRWRMVEELAKVFKSRPWVELVHSPVKAVKAKAKRATA
jgi:hypothetical protein